MVLEPSTATRAGAAVSLIDIRRTFRNQRARAAAALVQTSETNAFRCLDTDASRIAVLMAHLGGHLRSRFGDFQTTDGEEPDRHRDTELERGIIPIRQ